MTGWAVMHAGQEPNVQQEGRKGRGWASLTRVVRAGLTQEVTGAELNQVREPATQLVGERP